MLKLEISNSDGRSSHLAYELTRPEQTEQGDLCVLYCHGFASSRKSEKTVRFGRWLVASGVAFCCFDFQGHGDSGGDVADLTLSRNLEDVGRMLDLLRREGFQRFILIGSSMGGGVCSWYGAHNPGEIEAAIYIAPGFDLEAGVRRRLGEEAFANWQREGRIELHHELGSYYLDWRMIEDLRSYDRARLAELYGVPTLIFQGKNDTDVDWRMVLDLTVNSPGQSIQLHLIADGDHRLVGRLPLMWRLSRAFLIERGLLSAERSNLGDLELESERG